MGAGVGSFEACDDRLGGDRRSDSPRGLCRSSSGLQSEADGFPLFNSFFLRSRDGDKDDVEAGAGLAAEGDVAKLPPAVAATSKGRLRLVACCRWLAACCMRQWILNQLERLPYLEPDLDMPTMRHFLSLQALHAVRFFLLMMHR
jgi:hypothetical protein